MESSTSTGKKVAVSSHSISQQSVGVDIAVLMAGHCNSLTGMPQLDHRKVGELRASGFAIHPAVSKWTNPHPSTGLLKAAIA